MKRTNKPTVYSQSNNRDIYDWLYYGSYFKHFRYPPRFPSDETIETFKDNLEDIIQPKLKEALKRCGELKVVKDKKLEVISTKTKAGSFDRYFWALFISHEFSEYFVIQKWIRYWLRLWYKVSPQSLPPQAISRNSIDEWAIQQARNTPIENFFEGRLRRSGSRLVGLCPFHEERTPSFFIFQDNHFHCYGCQAHGDVIDFVMKTKEISFVEAVRCLL